MAFEVIWHNKNLSNIGDKHYLVFFFFVFFYNAINTILLYEGVHRPVAAFSAFCTAFLFLFLGCVFVVQTPYSDHFVTAKEI